MGYCSGSNCEKHPKQKQLPGVCSSCLRERLSKLKDYDHGQVNTKFSSMVSRSSSPSSSSPSLPAYSSTSPANNRHGHRRNGSEAITIPIGFVMRSGNTADVLKKSRSVTCAPRIMSKGKLNKEELMEGNCERKSGFWKKLIRSTSKKTIARLMHSKTVRV